MMAIVCVVTDYEYNYDDYNKHTYFRGNIIEKFVVNDIMMMMYLSGLHVVDICELHSRTTHRRW